MQEPIVQYADSALQNVAKKVHALSSQNTLRVHDPVVVLWSLHFVCSVI